jgi:hypothetical protein
MNEIELLFTSKNSTTTTTLINGVISELRKKIFTFGATNQPQLGRISHNLMALER